MSPTGKLTQATNNFSTVNREYDEVNRLKWDERVYSRWPN